MAERTTKVSNETWGTPEARRAEASRIVKIIAENCNVEEMQANEQKFIEQMSDEYAGVSPKQLAWMRTIKDKYL